LIRKVNIYSGKWSVCRRTDATGCMSVIKRGFEYFGGGKFLLSVMTDFTPFLILKLRVKTLFTQLDFAVRYLLV